MSRTIFALAVLAFATVLVGAEVFFRVLEFDFDRQERAQEELPIFFRQPRIPTGEVYFRRSGPATWIGQALPRGPEITANYDENGFRNSAELLDWDLVIAGDSFVELGHLAQERLFTSVLADKLSVRVKNLGVSYTGPLTHIHYLENYGIAPGTRHAILTFFEGNDLRDLEREAAALDRLHESGEREYREIVKQTSLLRAVGNLITGKSSRASDLRSQNARANAVLRLPGREESHQVRSFYRPPGGDELTPAQRRLLKAALHQWAETARARDITPWLLYMPCKRRVLFDYLEFASGVAAEIKDWTPTNLPSVISRLASAEGVHFINPTPALKRASKRGTLVYNLTDTHLTAGGSRVVAGSLTAHLGPALLGQGNRDQP